MRANESGQRFEYFPYGEEITVQNPQDREKFATYTRTSFFGLDYTWNRWYDSVHGVFISPDPHMGKPDIANPSAMNRYSYASGDPTNHRDPSGLDDLCDDPYDLSCALFTDPFESIASASPIPPCDGLSGYCSCIGALVIDPACVAIYGEMIATAWLASNQQATGPGSSIGGSPACFAQLKDGLSSPPYPLFSTPTTLSGGFRMFEALRTSFRLALKTGIWISG